MMDVDMDFEVVDYTLDPFSGQSIFGQPNPSQSLTAYTIYSASTLACTAPVVTLPGLSASSLHLGMLSIDSSALDCPPL